MGALLLQLPEVMSFRAGAASGILPRLSVTTRFELDGAPVTAEVTGSYADSCRVTFADDTSELSVLSVQGNRAHVVCDGHREDVVFATSGDELLFLHAGLLARWLKARTSSSRVAVWTVH